MTPAIWTEIGTGLWETLYSSVLSTIFSFILGLPLGVILAITDKGGLKANFIVNKILGIIVNVLRSVPFLILFVTVIPFTRLLVGTSIGAMAAVVPLTIAATPFVARLIETSVKEVDSGVIEAALSVGTPTIKIICKAILPEIIPSLLSNLAIAFVTIIGYSTMAGFCGGGGLGAIAVNYGYYRGNTKVMLVTVAIIIVVVQIFQEVGLWIAKKRDKRKKTQGKGIIMEIKILIAKLRDLRNGKQEKISSPEETQIDDVGDADIVDNADIDVADALKDIYAQIHGDEN